MVRGGCKKKRCENRGERRNENKVRCGKKKRIKDGETNKGRKKTKYKEVNERKDIQLEFKKKLRKEHIGRGGCEKKRNNGNEIRERKRQKGRRKCE